MYIWGISVKVFKLYIKKRFSYLSSLDSDFDLNIIETLHHHLDDLVPDTGADVDAADQHEVVEDDSLEEVKSSQPRPPAASF